MVLIDNSIVYQKKTNKVEMSFKVFTNETGAFILSKLQPTHTKVVVTRFREQTFPQLPDTVKSIELMSIQLNTLSSIAGFPSALENLKIWFQGGPKKGSIQLPPFPPTLKSLWLDNCDPVAIPPLPTSLQSLTLSHCNLSTIPDLPPNLADLTISNAGLVTLPTTWPPNLGYVDFSRNKIKAIESFPPNLYLIFLDYNQIQEIPEITIAGSPEINLDENPLREPFASIYNQYGEYRGELLEQGQDPKVADLYLKNAVNRVYALRRGFQQRRQNLKSRAKGILATKIFAKTANIPSNFSSELGSLLSGQPASKSLNAQYAAIKQQFPEFQPYGVTQQPFLPPHMERQERGKTRYRLQKLLNEERNIARKTLGGKRKHKTRKISRKSR